MKLTLVNKKDEAKGTKSFFFKSDEDITWIPGQYIYITLPKLNYPDERGPVRHFTISNSPTESKDIRITVRIREQSGYKKTLDELEIGATVEGKGPQGTFIINENIKDNIFIAGGIGITPFRSIIKYNVDNNLNIPMHLIYSNSDGDFVFKEDLNKIQSENNNIKVSYFNSSESGHLDAEKLKLLCDVSNKNNTFWVVGPNSFVNAIEDILEQLEVPSDKILTEKFTGY